VRLIPKDYSRSLRSAQSHHLVAGSQFRAPCIWSFFWWKQGSPSAHPYGHNQHTLWESFPLAIPA
jgi:hypothetical protein